MGFGSIPFSDHDVLRHNHNHSYRFFSDTCYPCLLVVRTSAGHHAQEAMEGEVERYFASNAAVVSIEGKLSALADSLVEQRTRELAVRLETIITALEEDGFDIPGTIATP